MSISGNMVGMYSSIGKTFIFTDDDGNELSGVITEQLTILNVTDKDVRKGVVYAGDEGISIGTQEMPSYVYAIIDGSNLCNEVRGTSKNCDNMTGYIAIPVYSLGYINKYYNANNNKWYSEASFVTEWIPE